MMEVERNAGDAAETHGAGILVDPRYNGPSSSGNGGYSSGLFAALIDGPAVVELRSPVPLGTELDVERPEKGVATVTDGDLHVATVRSAPALDLELPAAPTVEQAREASGGYRGASGTLFSSCFVCGPDRDDAFGVFAGPVPGRDLVASPWIPRPEAVDDSGSVREEMIWAVLDCPTYFALYPHESAGTPLAFLARMQAEIVSRPAVGDECVVAAWPIERDGRKLQAGSAIFDATGTPLGFARVLLIEARTGSVAPDGTS